jgi:uncharacterized protein with von Willebrand factor type A (vWA) domain
MSELLERVYSLKHESEFSKFSDEVKSSLKKMEKPDLTKIESSLQNALISLFNYQNTISEKRKEELVGKIESISGTAEEYAEAHKKLTESVESIVGKLQSSINSIEVPKTDLSSIEKSIKSIKPTDISNLQNQVQNLAIAVSKIKIPNQKVDLTPVLEAINNPKTKTVTFEVIDDRWGMPKKVIATEEYE